MTKNLIARPAGAELEAHNRGQRSYFERGIKPTMVPVDTPYLRRHVDEAVRAARVEGDDRVLEVGCGMGRYTLLLAERGIHVEGFDLSPVLLSHLDRFNGGRFDVPLHCGDLLNPASALDGAFDVVMGFFVLHHIVDLEASFRSVRRLLKPGGRCVFVEPNAYNPLFYIQILMTPGMTWAGDKGVAGMRAGRVQDAMGAAGLSGCRVERFGFFPPFMANRPWGPAWERRLEQRAALRPFLPFQTFYGERVG
jgi:SAM-dependent methyltransferase